MNKIWIYLFLSIFLSYIVSAVSISGSKYIISCSPDDSPIQSNGFTQYCSYTWNGINNITRDIAFCFDTKIVNAKIIYNHNQDITSLFKYKNYAMTKGDCYYVNNVKWLPNETKNLKITYLPTNINNPKWDTYFGNITASRIDLKLDPTFNSTHYEIGTNRGILYYWVNSTYHLNIDLLSNTANTNILGNYITTTNNIYNGTKTYTGTTAFDNNNITIRNITITTATISPNTSGSIQYIEATDTINITGSNINFASQGSSGGLGVSTSWTDCRQGTAGSGSGGGGAPGQVSPYTTCGGGGGAGFWTTGTAGGTGGGSSGGSGGSLYGTNQGDDIALGSGGGGGGGDSGGQDGSRSKGKGGTGGGAIYIKGYNIIIKDTTISLSGGSPGVNSIGCGGGGGSGGQLFLEGAICILNNVTIDIAGGTGGGSTVYDDCGTVASGGNGAVGRIKYKCTTENFSNVTIITGTEYNTTNTYTSYIKSSGNVVSNQINLTTFVSQFKITSNYSGSVMANISFDGGSSFEYVNLSNTSWITPSSSVGINNKLLYRLYLLDNQTSINDFQLDFNPSVFQLNLSSYEIVSGNLLNYTTNIVGSDYSNTITTDNRTLSLLLNGGIYNVSVSKSEYFGCNYNNIILNQTTILSNCTLYNAVLNITAIDNNNLPINSFTTNITDNLNGAFYSNSTTTGLVQFNILKDRNYTLRINQSIFGIGTPTVSSTYNIFIFVNSILLKIFDELTGLIILQNISVDIIDMTNPSKISLSTISGTLNVSALSGDVYNIRLWNNNYTLRDYFIITGYLVNTINAYLLPISSSQNVSICFDSAGLPIPDLLVNEYVITYSSYNLVQSGYTDVNGRITFSFASSNYYLYNISSTEYVTRSFLLFPPDNSIIQSCGCNYCVSLTEVSAGVSYPTTNISGSITFNNVSKILTFDYISSNPSYFNYSYTVSKISNDRYYVLCFDSSTSISNSFNCNLSGYNGLVFVQGVANNNLIFYGNNYDLGGRLGLFDSRSPQDASYIAGFIMLIIVMSGLFFGAYGTIIMTPIGLGIIFILGIFSPLTLTLLGISLIVSLVIAIGVKRY